MKTSIDVECTSSLLEDQTLKAEQSEIPTGPSPMTTMSEVHIKEENETKIPNQFTCELGKPENLEAPLSTIKKSIDVLTTPICSIESIRGAIDLSLDLQNSNKLISNVTQGAVKQECPPPNSSTNFTSNGNLDNDELNLTNLTVCYKIRCEREDNVKTSNILSCDRPTFLKSLSLCEDEKPEELLKSEIELGEIKVGFQNELGIRCQEFDKTPQLQIILEKLSIANKSHKKAIENLANAIPELKRIDSRIIQKVNRQGFIKISSDFLKPLLPQPSKKKYPKGHYFSRLKKVTYEKDEFDKRFFHNALRRGACIDDKGKFLKYQCPTCPYKTWSFYALSKHHRGLHGFLINWTFTCPDCNFTSKQECSLKRHQQSHKKEPDLPCPHCPYLTRFDGALRVHLRRWHLPDEQANTLKCTYCNFVSISKSTYQAHLMVHISRNQNNMYRFLHKSTTSNEREVLKCEYCKFQTPNKNVLRSHIVQTHKIPNPFKKQLYHCKYCGFETRHRFSFENHRLIHEEVEDASLFQCYNCGYKTKWRKYLVVHMRTNHYKERRRKEIVYYHCAECDKKFSKKNLLKKHIFRQHRKLKVLL